MYYKHVALVLYFRIAMSFGMGGNIAKYTSFTCLLCDISYYIKKGIIFNKKNVALLIFILFIKNVNQIARY